MNFRDNSPKISGFRYVHSGRGELIVLSARNLTDRDVFFLKLSAKTFNRLVSLSTNRVVCDDFQNQLDSPLEIQSKMNPLFHVLDTWRKPCEQENRQKSEC